MKKTWFVGSLLLLAGWGSPLAAVPVATPNLNPQVVSAAPSIASKAKVELIDPGAQPRQILRYQPAVNTKEVSTLTMAMDMKMSLSGKSFPSKLPGTVMKMETLVTKVDPNGDIHYTFRYSDADVGESKSTPPALITAMRSQLKKLVGMTGTFVIDNRGQVKSSNLKIPANIDAMTKQMLEQMSQSLDQLSSPLPEAAIGTGAKWRIVQPLQFSGMNLTQTEMFELVSVDAGKVTLKANVTQEARSQTLNQPGLPKGATVSLKSLNSTGQGETRLRLDRLMPSQAKVSVTSTSQMETSSPQLTTPMAIDTEAQIEVTLISQ